MSSWLITNAVAVWLLPPGCLLLMAGAGALCLRKRPRTGKSLITLSLLLLWALSTPWVAHLLLGMMETPFRNPLDVPPAQAIVVLGGGKYRKAPEYENADVSGGATLVRLRYAALLHRLTGKPILVSGGSPDGSSVPEAQTMKSALENEFKTTVAWTENVSSNTLENASASFRILQPLGVTRVYLVTHAWHMPRAQRVFMKVGFSVVPAPTAFSVRRDFTLFDFLPNADALHQSRLVFHEVIGLAWYQLKSALD
jgi:uncharacterized SAM-binding protein YcdF (DUF218 family)